MRRIGVDEQTWRAIQKMLKRAADGTARRVDWEYPCESSTGVVGELKHREAVEVTYLDDNGDLVQEETKAFYRVYYNEPTLCPTELWAVGMGVKSRHEQFDSTDQQTDIDLAALRASTTHATGRDLFNLKL